MADFAECASHDDRHDQRSFGGQAQFTQTLGDTQRRLLRVLQIDGRPPTRNWHEGHFCLPKQLNGC